MIKLIGLFACFFLIAAGQQYFTADLRFDGTDQTDTTVVVDFGKGEKGFVDNWPYMIVKISSNETVLYKNHSDFNFYTCRTEAGCEVQEPASMRKIPWEDDRSINASRITPQLSFGKGLWTLATPSSALWAVDDFAPLDKNHSSQPYGYIGLGFEGQAMNNYLTQYPIFSISINIQKQRGELIFGKDAGRYNEDKPPVVLNTTANWETNISDASIGSVTKKLPKSRLMIFDFSYPNIILPEEFKAMLDEFAQKNNMTAEGDQYFFEGNITDVNKLPPLKFHSANGSAISIPPAAYMKRTSNEEKETYFFSIMHFGEKIILGHSVISQFYLVFEGKDIRYPTVSIYELPDPNAPPKKKEEPVKPTILIAIGVVLLIIASSLAFYCGRKSQVKKLDDYLKLQADKGDSKSTFVV